MDICGEILRLEMKSRQMKMSRMVQFLTGKITDSVTATFPTKMFWGFLGFLLLCSSVAQLGTLVFFAQEVSHSSQNDSFKVCL